MIKDKKFEEIYKPDYSKMSETFEEITLEQYKYMIEELYMSGAMIELIYNQKPRQAEKLQKKFKGLVKSNRLKATELSNLYHFGVKSTNSLKSTRDKVNQTMNDRYGGWFTKTNEYKEKSQETCQLKYGVDYTSQIEGRMDKVKATNLKNCGYESNLQDPKFIKKSQEIKLERYGNAHYVNVEKAKQTKLERYGNKNYNNINKIVENWNNKSEEEKLEIFQKTKDTKFHLYGDANYTNREQYLKTVREKYNVNNTFQVEEYKEKSQETCQEKYGSDRYCQSDEFKELYNNVKFVEEINEKRSKTLFNNYGISNTFQIEEVKEKSKQTNLNKRGVEYYSQSDEFKKLFENQDWVNEINRKKTETMRQNNTFTGSKEEDIIYEQIIQLFPNTIRNYDSDERYKHKCDFYIPELDMFIEYQGTWFHGRAPFDPTNVKHIKLLEKWQNKAQNENNKSLRTKPNSQYINAINCWTKKDVIKREEAKRNNLNYIELWNMKDFRILYEKLLLLKN